MGFISSEERARLVGAETLSTGTPIPLQMVASDEYVPVPRTRQQEEVAHCLARLADDIAPGLGLSRRGFFRTAGGMAAAYLAMNQIYGELFAASLDEASHPDVASARADSLRQQFIIDVHTHFVRDEFGRMAAGAATPFPWRKAVSELGWNPQIKDDISMEAVKYANYYKEIYLDSDTDIALISSVPGSPANLMPLTNAGMAEARERINRQAGARRMLSHAIFAPGAPGWLEDLDAAIALRPDSWKGYTIGSAGRDASGSIGKLWPWRMDGDEAYKGYEKMVKAGITTVCVHKGLFPPSLEQEFPQLRGFVDVSDVGQAAKDWPQLDFVIYHAGYRHLDDPARALQDPRIALEEFERTGRISWVSDLAEIPAQYGVRNVYADIGQVFAMTLISQPRICAAILGILIRGLGADRVCWGTDAVWTGSPQWQIEGLRRLEIPRDMRNRHDFAALGDANGPVKRAIFFDNSARLYGITPTDQAAIRKDAIAMDKARYQQAGSTQSNLQYGFVAP